jgi:hypothetical protein
MSKKASFNERYSIKIVPFSKPSHPWKPSSSPISAWNVIHSITKKRPAEDILPTIPESDPPSPKNNTPPIPKKPRISEYIQGCHSNIHPESIKQKLCTICLGNYSNAESLRIHCVRTHFSLYEDFEEPAFRECYFCCLRFKYEDTEEEFNEFKDNPEHLSFAMHVRKHQGSTPFECVLCKQAFTQKRILSSHYRQTHKIERPIFHAALINDQFKPVSIIAREELESSEDEDEVNEEGESEQKEENEIKTDTDMELEKVVKDEDDAEAGLSGSQEIGTEEDVDLADVDSDNSDRQLRKKMKR